MREYPWNDFETDIRGMFLEYSGNITLRLLEFAKRSIFVIIKSYTFNTKTTFPSRTFCKVFFFKMLPKCSLDVPNIVTLGEHSVNIVTLGEHSVNIVTLGDYSVNIVTLGEHSVNIVTLREHAVNIPGISRAGWEGFSGDRKMLMLL